MSPRGGPGLEVCRVYSQPSLFLPPFFLSLALAEGKDERGVAAAFGYILAHPLDSARGEARREQSSDLRRYIVVPRKLRRDGDNIEARDSVLSGAQGCSSLPARCWSGQLTLTILSSARA